VSEHVFSKGFFPTLVSGQVYHEKVDLCMESERLEAVKLADYKQPHSKPFSQRYMDYADYDVGPLLLAHILSSFGLKGRNPKYRFMVIVKWCKDFIRPVLNGAPNILRDRLDIAKRTLIAAMKALGRQCFLLRAMHLMYPS
jgi:hypothetical protein